MDETKKKPELTFSREYTLQFRNYLVRLFGLPVVRTTIREFHSNLARFVNGDEALLKTLMEAFIQGKLPIEMQSKEHLRDMIDEFSPLVKLAKEVHDRGDFLNFVTSDQVSYQDKIVFHHYIRQVDGEEMRFVTDIQTMSQLIHHLTQRLADAANAESSQKDLEELSPLLKNAVQNLQHALKLANN